ncbi:MAG: PAS domain-containing protein, partial [Burkholderiaceae bacterium]
MLELLDRVEVLASVKEIASGRYLHVNARMAELLGRSAEHLVGATDAELMESAQANALRAAEQVALAHAEPAPSEHRFERAGVKREFTVIRIAVPRADGAPAR